MGNTVYKILKLQSGYTWGPSIPIVLMGTIHPYCTHGDHPSLLFSWGPSIPIVHMGTIHPYCTHGDMSVSMLIIPCGHNLFSSYRLDYAHER